MMASLTEVDPVVTDQVDEAVLLRDATGPHVCPEVAQPLRFPFSREGRAHNFLDKRPEPVHHPWLLPRPASQILTKL